MSQLPASEPSSRSPLHRVRHAVALGAMRNMWSSESRWRWLAAVSVGLMLLLWALRQPLADRLWPETRAQTLEADAALALAAGRLTATDGQGARELYEAALAVDPDRSSARAGLMRVGYAGLSQARAAILAGRFAQAHQHLDLARELAVPRAQVEALARVLRDREAADAGIERLLPRAIAAQKAGRLDDGDDSALALYQRVLELQPNHTAALEGREDVLADLLQDAAKLLADGALVQGAQVVSRVQAADPGHVGLPDALERVNQAIDQRRQAADRDLRAQRLPAALQGYRDLLAAAPGDVEAQRGIASVVASHAQRSEHLASDFRFVEAEAALRQAIQIDPNSAVVAEARRHLQRARQAQPQLQRPLSRSARQRLERLLKQAADAEARGRLLSPPGESAFDHLRAARALAPQDPRVRRASARLLPAARRCFESELRDNRLARAGECLDARRVLEGDTDAVREARRRLAQRWIAVGDERLGAGEMAAAQAALTAARSWDTTAPGLDEFAERLRAADVTP